MEARNERLALEKKAADLKRDIEEPLRVQILQVMAAQGLKSANVEGLGRVVCKESHHYEIMDIEGLAYQMFKSMVKAAEEGRPLSDGLLLQRRVHRENLDAMIEAAGGMGKAAEFGVRNVTKTDLSYTKV